MEKSLIEAVFGSGTEAHLTMWFQLQKGWQRTELNGKMLLNVWVIFINRMIKTWR